MSEFTKESWEVQSIYCDGALVNYGIDYQQSVIVIGNKMGDIALVNNTRSEEEQEIISHLIAAAPDMYEALVKAGKHHQGFHSEIGILIRKALSKAKGE